MNRMNFLTNNKASKKLLALLLIVAFGSLSFVIPEQVSADGALSVSTTDTVAGYTTKIKVYRTTPSSKITLELQKPDGTNLNFPLESGPDGGAELELNSYHTQKAGRYTATAYLNDARGMRAQSTFEVFADKPSETLSNIVANKKLLRADGNEESHVVVSLMDQYKNPIQNHLVKLVSSRAEDSIASAENSSYTNLDGKVVFKVRSSQSGMSTLTALNATTNEILSERETIVFTDTQRAVGGDDFSPTPTSALRASLLAQATTTTTTSGKRLNIFTTPKDSVAVGTPFDITVEVLTSDGQPALDYRGRVMLLSDDTNAELPLANIGYQFTGAEQPGAIKVYAKGARFFSAGQKTIEVVDVDDSTLRDSITINVTGQNTSTNDTIAITKPAAGILTTKDVVVEGTATPFAKVVLYDNATEVSSVTADSTGRFESTLRSLTDGTHILEAKIMDAQNQPITASTPVQFTLKAAGPTVSGLTYTPAAGPYTAGQTIGVQFDSEPALAEALYVIDDKSFTMIESAEVKGRYTGNIVLPTNAGTFDVQIQLRSTIGALGGATLPAAMVVTAPSFDPATLTYSIEGNTSIKAAWTNAANTTVKKYRILWGQNKSNLTDKIDLAPTESSYVFKNLTGNMTYYFQFQALGDNDAVLVADQIKMVTTPDYLQISDARADRQEGSFLISWKAKGPLSKIAKYRIVYGISPDNYIREVDATADKNTAVIDSLVDATPHYFRIEALDVSGEPIARSDEISGTVGLKPAAGGPECTPADVTNLRVSVQNGQKVLMWDTIDSAEGYRVYMSDEANNFKDAPTVVNATSYALPALSKDKKQYYFAVTAYCGGQESRNLSQAIKVSSGPLAIMFFGAAAGLAGYATYRRRKAI